LKASVRTKGQKIPPPFPNGWFMIAESSEIVAGVATSINCLGENFVVYRSNKDGKVFVLDAFCPHMGANLGVGGIVRGDCIECPFHQWRFSGEDGRCTEVPYSSSSGESKSSFSKFELSG
jgi:cholesterol 7-desaturase